MLEPSRVNIMSSCRICLSNKRPLCPLFRYELSGNYAEMLTAIADVKVASNDGLPEKICNKCCTSLEKAYLLKTVAERSDRELRKLRVRDSKNVSTKKIAFDSFTDIKSEIGPLAVKNEPKWEMEIDTSRANIQPNIDVVEPKDIVIADTIIRKVESNEPNSNNNFEADNDFFDDDVYLDDDDDDYVPPTEKPKPKFKKPKLSEIKVFKGKKPIVRKVKVIKQFKQEPYEESSTIVIDDKKSTTITCYPIMKNGTKGPAILLRRPKDATILKVHPNYKHRNASKSDYRGIKRENIRRVKSAKPISKEREKLVCPVCGILTYTLGNHIATHEEKKKYTCSECPRSFVQKSNLLIHIKQHSGVKDHICEVCGAGFYTQKSLVRHNLIHKGERPFQCNLCSKKFIARCDLNRHLRIHAGYKPYKCTTCAMSFNAKHQLQNHERMHTGERPYTCEVCSVAFSYKVNLNNHVFKVHGINLKFKSIHTVTEDILRKELGMMTEAGEAIAHIMPQLSDVPTPGAHETVHHTSDYNS
ncbi:gastrula zinc finger protein XlCGF26.1-like [Pararge aegeria]|uniref:Jg9468 protein n=4 Tax=Pararge aegeria TaxID=116150 RepID=A0A8S4RHT9_9NEOP|nr:gastrula zinc finger protein XlCGF26.1-like [Pararge aegeria]CAH2236975.1 jg9468 [Pararge aegeria aegeria]